MLEILGEQVIQIVFAIILAAIGLAFAWLLVTLAKSGKFKNLEAAIGALKSNSYTVSAALQQEFVEKWKADSKDGKLTETEIANLKSMAMQRVLAMTVPAFMSLLIAAGADVTALIENTVQEWVDNNHKTGK